MPPPLAQSVSFADGRFTGGEIATFLPRLPRAAARAKAVNIVAQGRKKAPYSEQAGKEPA